jgi:hypothetical protein
MNLPRDVFFGKLVRLLRERGLTMHTPIRGETYTQPKRRHIRYVGDDGLVHFLTL